MKELVIVFLTIAVSTAYRDGRTASPIRPFDDFPPYQRGHERSPFENRYQSFPEQPFKSRHYHSYRARPFREESSYQERPSYKDQSLAGDYSSYKDQAYYAQSSFKPFREEESFGKPSPFYESQSSSFKDNLNFKGHSFENAIPFKNQYTDQTAGKYEDSFPQLPYREQSSYQQQQRETIGENQSDPYKTKDFDRPTVSEKEHLEAQSSNYDRFADYLKYGNHGLGFASVPVISSYENPLPLNEEPSTTSQPATAPTATHMPLQQSTLSSGSTTITEIHKSQTSELKMSSVESSTIATTQSVKSNTGRKVAMPLAEMLPTVPTQTGSTKPVPSTTATTKGFANLGHSTAPMTNNMVTEAPIMSFQGQTLPPIRFSLGNVTLPPSFYLSDDLKNKELLKYLFPESKDILKSNVQNQMMSYMLPDILSNSVDNNVQRPFLNYGLPMESKNTLKESLRDSLLSYLLQQSSKDRLSFPQSSIADSLNYVPLSSVTQRPTFSLPSISLSSLPQISRPVQTVNYVSPTLQRSPFLTATSSQPTGFNIDGILPSSLASALPNNLQTGISTGLSGGLTSGISSGVPATLSSSTSSGMPALNLGQTFPQFDRMRSFGSTSNQPFAQVSTFFNQDSAKMNRGLPLQLGGFAGIDYSALQSSNPVSQPVELGFAKMGLSLPEYSRPHLPTFTKNGFGHQIW